WVVVAHCHLVHWASTGVVRLLRSDATALRIVGVRLNCLAQRVSYERDQGIAVWVGIGKVVLGAIRIGDSRKPACREIVVIGREGPNGIRDTRAQAGIAWVGVVESEDSS